MIHNFINVWCVLADSRRGLGRMCGRSDVPFFHQFTCNLCIARDDCTPTECMTILFIPLRWQSIFFVILWLNAMFSLDFLLFSFRWLVTVASHYFSLIVLSLISCSLCLHTESSYIYQISYHRLWASRRNWNPQQYQVRIYIEIYAIVIESIA